MAVVDPSPGAGASWAAAGMLAPVTEVHYGEDRLLALNLESNRRYAAFVAELEEVSGRSAGYRPCGTIVVARDVDDNAALADLFAFQEQLGLDVTRLRGRECRELEPGLAPGVRGGILVEGDHQVDNRALVKALLAAGEATGVEVLPERVERVEVAHGRVASVATARGTIAAGAVVLAAGCWSSQIPGLPAEAVPPVRPVKGQLLHLRTPVADRPAILAARNVRGLDVYVVPRADGRVVVGATVEERSFDTTVTAGAVFTLLRAAYELLPGITELELVETTAGLRPGSPDNAPILGTTPVEGLICATGHFRNGILLTPVTADAIAELVDTGRTPVEIEPFTPERFRR